MITSRKSCYCAFCKTPRKVYTDKHLTYFEVLSLVLLCIIFTYAFYQSLDVRGLYFVGIILLIGEAFSQLKWRASMICRNCGFDPVVYVRNPEQAGLKIKAFLEKRNDSPEHLLRSPVILPKRKHQKGENLSLKM
jgi:hypothetical protein